MPTPGAIQIEQELTKRQRISQRGEPPWEVAWCFPLQGDWTEADYLEFERANNSIELVDGCLELLPMPTRGHQRIIRWLLQQLEPVVKRHRLGEVLFAPCPVRLRPGLMREPDLYVVRSTDAEPADAADVLCIFEIVSAGAANRERDLTTKRQEYAKARIPEYWIVDPEEQLVTALVLDSNGYRVSGEFRPGDVALASTIPDFAVSVSDLFASASVAAAKNNE